jgi:hypothetical protein
VTSVHGHVRSYITLLMLKPCIKSNDFKAPSSTDFNLLLFTQAHNRTTMPNPISPHGSNGPLCVNSLSCNRIPLIRTPGARMQSYSQSSRPEVRGIGSLRHDLNNAIRRGRNKSMSRRESISIQRGRVIIELE